MPPWFMISGHSFWLLEIPVEVYVAVTRKLISKRDAIMTFLQKSSYKASLAAAPFLIVGNGRVAQRKPYLLFFCFQLLPMQKIK